MSKRDVLKAMSINDMVKSIEEDKGEEAISWGELANLTHATQVERFGWCICEGTNGEGQLADDCPKEESAPNWTVWVGGGEVNSYYLSETQAKDIAQAWIDKGYDDVVVEEVK